jgi:DNA-3-methyladenine glycosylase I
MKRCDWCLGDALYMKYHDEEWGVPLYDDQRLFEMLVLEGMQAGLSWLTILKRRENYRSLFNKFKPQLIARYDDKKLSTVLQDPGIIRNKRKIFAIRRNAQAFLKLQEEYSGFKNYIWQFVAGKPIKNSWQRLEEVPITTPISDVMSQELKKHGFAFVGSTICYAYMQAVGMVNDHLLTCYRYIPVSSL